MCLIKVSDVESADLFFLQFCRCFEELYGRGLAHRIFICTCISLDYGPPHAFWCLAFERYNGILGSNYTNKKAIESQFMRKFLIDQQVQGLHISPDNPLSSLLPLRNDLASPCSVLDFCCDTTSTLEMLRLHEEEVQLISSNNGVVVPLPPFHEKLSKCNG